MTRSLLDYEVLSFDCYGTLIDWETGIWSGLQPLLTDNAADIDRSTALTVFGEIEADAETAYPRRLYTEILAQVHHGLALRLGLETRDDLDAAFAASVPQWPPFPDSSEALSQLGGRYRLVVLSNVDRHSFAASNLRLGVTFDAVCTAEDIGCYKPDPAAFDYLLGKVDEQFGAPPEAILHVAQSLYHDHAPAKAAGLDTVWIDRQGLTRGGDWGATRPVDEHPKPDHVFHTLAEMVEAVENA